MAERFRKPPLAELAAEMRWGTGQMLISPHGPGQILAISIGQHEDFFTRFGACVGALGFDRTERLVPLGFPTAPYQAIYRFRKKDPSEGTALYQVGAGVFTTNITPPYHSWTHFRPLIERGFQCVLSTRGPSESELPFSQVSLRYINSFGERFTEGRSPASFMGDVLGFKIELPDSLRVEMPPGSEPKPVLQFGVPLKSGQQMNVILAEGVVSGERSFVMDITVLQEGPFLSSRVMEALDTARGAVHRMFIGVTKDLESVMEPVADGGE